MSCVLCLSPGVAWIDGGVGRGREGCGGETEARQMWWSWDVGRAGGVLDMRGPGSRRWGTCLPVTSVGPGLKAEVMERGRERGGGGRGVWRRCRGGRGG